MHLTEKGMMNKFHYFIAFIKTHVRNFLNFERTFLPVLYPKNWDPSFVDFERNLVYFVLCMIGNKVKARRVLVVEKHEGVLK